MEIQIADEAALHTQALTATRVRPQDRHLDATLDDAFNDVKRLIDAEGWWWFDDGPIRRIRL